MAGTDQLQIRLYTPTVNSEWLPGYKLVISCPGVLQQRNTVLMTSGLGLPSVNQHCISATAHLDRISLILILCYRLHVHYLQDGAKFDMEKYVTNT